MRQDIIEPLFVARKCSHFFKIERFGLLDGKPKTFEEVGMRFKVSRERVRQIEAKALCKMRHPTRSKQLQAFLDLLEEE